MGKVITADELAVLVHDLISKPENLGAMDDTDQYTRFLCDIGNVVADHCGGRIVFVSPPDFTKKDLDAETLTDERFMDTHRDAMSWCVHIQGDESLPDLENNVWTHHGFDPESDPFTVEG